MQLERGVLVDGVLMGEDSVEEISYTIHAVFLGGLLVNERALCAFIHFEKCLECMFTAGECEVEVGFQAQTQVV